MSSRSARCQKASLWCLARHILPDTNRIREHGTNRRHYEVPEERRFVSGGDIVRPGWLQRKHSLGERSSSSLREVGASIAHQGAPAGIVPEGQRQTKRNPGPEVL